MRNFVPDNRASLAGRGRGLAGTGRIPPAFATGDFP